MLLAIDTSSDRASIALVEKNNLTAECTWHCGQNHSVELLPQISCLLEQAGLSIQSITGVVVALGPGSFNGLRVGVSTAKGLAFSLDIPVVGVGTLETSAYQHAETGLPICSMANAGRGEIAAAFYHNKEGEWLQLVPEHIITVEAVLSEITDTTVFCGESVIPIADLIKEQLGQKAVIPPAASQYRRAGFLAELGQQRLEAGKQDNPATLQPLYLRKPPITKPKRSISL